LVFFWIFFLVLACSELQHEAPGFDHEVALDSLYFSYAAFCNKTALTKWDCQWCSRNSATLVQFLESSEFGTRGYVAVDKANHRVLVSYRGSSNWQNTLEDAAAIKQVSSPFSSDPNVKLAYGFLVAYESVRNLTVAAVEKGLAACGSNCVVQFHGHSLGAAMATIAASDIATVVTAPCKLYTFGCPRAGNKAFADLLASSTGPNMRMTRLHDPVPGLPLQNMLVETFHQYHNEVYNTYNTTYGDQNYRVCNGSGEDTSCYDSEFGIIKQPSEHTKYMGIPGGGCSGG